MKTLKRTVLLNIQHDTMQHLKMMVQIHGYNKGDICDIYKATNQSIFKTI
jgi:hypothetical protein